MVNIFLFSNWNQLSGLRSTDYPNLRLQVTQFKSEDLIGTKIDIFDTENNIPYFSGFVRVVESHRFNPLAVFEVDDMIKRINAYGFNIAITDPIDLQPEVVTMLKGLYALGYNYLTLEYSKATKTEDKALYQTDIDSDKTDFQTYNWEPLPTVVFSNKYLAVTKTLSDVRRKPKIWLRQPTNKDIYVISEAPGFNWENFKWVKPTEVYSIEKLINPSDDSKNPISDAIIKDDEEEIITPEGE